MNKYHYINITVVMRDCESITDAKRQCTKLLPCHPDETTKHMESWEIVNVVDPMMQENVYES